MAKDFIDDDLLTGAAGGNKTEERDGVPIRPITEASLTRMARQKKDMQEQVVGAVREIETLRQRQNSLEKARSDLEELGRKQGEYESGKRDVMEKLARALIMAEKEEALAARRVELLSVMRSRFKDSLGELRGIDEAKWTDANYEVELNKALVLVADATSVYRKAMAKIDAEAWEQGHVEAPAATALTREAERELGRRQGFGYWLMAGSALVIPFLVAAVLAIVVNRLLGRILQ